MDERGDLSKAMCEFRFRSTIIEDDKHALACLRYIDRNPIKARFVDHPAKRYLNSFQSYAYGKNHPLLPRQPHPTYLAVTETEPKRYKAYQEFVLGDDLCSDQLHGKLERLQFFGSDEFIEEVKASLQ